jgi:hypothetical protein
MPKGHDNNTCNVEERSAHLTRYTNQELSAKLD